MKNLSYFIITLTILTSSNTLNPSIIDPKVIIHEYDPTNITVLKKKLDYIIKTKTGITQNIHMFAPDHFQSDSQLEIGSIITVPPLVIALCAGLYKRADKLLALMNLAETDTYDQNQYKYPLLYLINFVLPQQVNRPYLNAVLFDHGASIKNTEKARKYRMASKYVNYPNGTSYTTKKLSYFPLKKAFTNKTIKAQHILLFSQDD